MHGIYLGEETHQAITSEKKEQIEAMFFRLSTMLYSFKLKKKKRKGAWLYFLYGKKEYILQLLLIL